MASSLGVQRGHQNQGVHPGGSVREASQGDQPGIYPGDPSRGLAMGSSYTRAPASHVTQLAMAPARYEFHVAMSSSPVYHCPQLAMESS